MLYFPYCSKWGNIHHREMILILKVMTDINSILQRIDQVLKSNKSSEIIWIICTVALFVCGITCFILAICTQHFAWSSPSAVTTTLLYFPIKEIKSLRAKNIALATAPILITQLPPDKAAVEIQKLLQNLYGENHG